jgi:hypothetical protein
MRKSLQFAFAAGSMFVFASAATAQDATVRFSPVFPVQPQIAHEYAPYSVLPSMIWRVTSEEDEPILGAQSSGLNVKKRAHFQIWRTITLGTHKGVNAYRDALDSARIKIGDSADEILGRPAFPYTRTKIDVELALLSAAELGVESESALSDVYKRARQVGLELCPAEVGPQLRLGYRNQPLGDALNIAMEPVATYSGNPTILALVNFGTGLALIGSDGRWEFMVPRTWRFVFALPANGRLEALREPQVVPTSEQTGPALR